MVAKSWVSTSRWGDLASELLLIEYTYLSAYYIRSAYKQFSSGYYRDHTHYFTYCLMISLCCWCRMILYLDLSFDYSVSMFKIYLFLGSIFLFAGFSTVSSLWIKILIFSRYDFEQDRQLARYRKSVIVHLVANLAVLCCYIVGIVYEVKYQDDIFDTFEFSSSLLLLIALCVPGISLVFRIRKYVQTAPGRLYYWILASLVVFTYKVLVCTLMLISDNVFGILKEDIGW
jgi:hypothetical protein